MLPNSEAICSHFLETGVVGDVPALHQRVTLGKRQHILEVVRELADAQQRHEDVWNNKPRRDRVVKRYTPVLFYREQGLTRKWSELSKLEKGFFISELNDDETITEKKISEVDKQLMKSYKRKAETPQIKETGAKKMKIEKSSPKPSARATRQRKRN